MAAARPLLPESRASLARRRFDVAGAVTVTGGLSVLVYAVVTAASHGWASATTIGLLAGAAALLAAFVVIEARSAAPLLPLTFFRNRTVTAANLAGLLLGGLLFPMFVFLSLYMQQVLGYSAIKAGLAFLVIAGGLIASSALAQGLVTRVGAKLVLTAGLLGLAVAQVLFARLPVAGHFTACLLPGFVRRGCRTRACLRRRRHRLHHRRQTRRRGRGLRADQRQPADRRCHRPGRRHQRRRRPHRGPAARRPPDRPQRWPAGSTTRSSSPAPWPWPPPSQRPPSSAAPAHKHPAPARSGRARRRLPEEREPLMPATATRPGRARVTTVPGQRSRLLRLPGIALHPARLSTPPLRTAGSHQREQRPASWLELFFDLPGTAMRQAEL